MNDLMIKNKLRSIKPRPCGAKSPTLIIASIGTSASDDPLETELEKAICAQGLGIDAVTDHSFYGDIERFHSMLCERLDIVVSTVACYEYAAKFPGHDFRRGAPGAAIESIRDQVRRGVDLITVHASLLRSHLGPLAASNRLIPMTSKGGGIIAAYLRGTGRENPYFEAFDELLDILAEYDVTLSLGTSFRPASVCDTWDTLMAIELETMGELVERATARGVQVMVEGIGHATIGAIPTYVALAKSICGGAPYRVLPMAIDTALGYDHISGAISAAVSVAAGADAITCISRAEHIGLPSAGDLEEAIVAGKIAARCGELTKLGDFSREAQMSRTRWGQGCKGDWTASVHPQGAAEALKAKGRLDDQLIQCGMCGDYCGIAAGISSVQHQHRAHSDAEIS
jgi:phosphomethylpyrimidine synthase